MHPLRYFTGLDGQRVTWCLGSSYQGFYGAATTEVPQTGCVPLLKHNSTRICTETKKGDTEGWPWKKPAVRERKGSGLKPNVFCASPPRYGAVRRCCVLPFSESRLTLLPSTIFPFLFPPLEIRSSLHNFVLSPSNLPLAAILLSHRQSHQRLPLLSSSPLASLLLTSRGLKNPPSLMKSLLLLKTATAPASTRCRLLLCYTVYVLGIFLPWFVCLGDGRR